MTIDSEPSIEHHTLSQGARLATVCRPGSKGFYLTMIVPVGWQDDPPGTPGIAHFVEHLMFAGSNRPVIDRLSDQGVWYQAATSNDYTEYQFSGHLDLLPGVLEFLAGVFTPLDCDKREVDTERGVIACELIDRQPESLHKRNRALNRYWACLFESPNLWDDPRAKQALNRINLDRLRRFHEVKYRVSRTALAVCSPLGHPEAARRLEEALPNQPETPSEESSPETSPTKLPPVSFSHDLSQNVWLYLNAITTNTSPRMDLVAVAVHHELGGGSHAIMQQEFRRRTGNAYQADTYVRFDAAWTWLGLITSVARKEAAPSAEFLVNELRRFAEERLTQEVLDKHVQYLKHWSEMASDRPHDLTETLAAWAARDQYQGMTPAKIACIAADLSLEEARGLAEQLLAPENLTMFVGGPIPWWQRHRFRRLLRR